MQSFNFKMHLFEYKIFADNTYFPLRNEASKLKEMN